MSIIRDGRNNYKADCKKKIDTTRNNVAPDLTISLNWHYRDPNLTAVRILTMIIKW